MIVICSRNNDIDRVDLADTLATSTPKNRGMRRPILLCIWVALIFGTSCTVIRPNEFFELIAGFTGANEESMQRFTRFWGLSWFVIVKGWHVTEYVVLTFFTVSAVEWWRNKITHWSIVGSMLICIAFAASDEWHQSFIPDRFGTVQDVLIDSLGICAAGSILLLRVKRKSANNHAMHRSGGGQQI